MPLIHPTAIIDCDAHIGAGTKIWHWTHVCEGAVVGDGCIVGQGVYVAPRVQIGRRVKIQNGVSIFSGVVLEDDVFCGPSVVFTNVLNPRAFIERKSEFRETRVGVGASLGANATILCGVIIGHFALVGAGSVVTRDVPSYAVVKGNPARRTGWVSRAGEALIFDNCRAQCPIGREWYSLDDGVCRAVH